MLCLASRTRRVCLLSISVTSVATGATHTWTGGISPFPQSSMNNAAAWSGGVPVSGSSNLALVFPNMALSNTPNQNIANPLVLQHLTIAGGYTFSGNGIRFDNLGAAPTWTQNSSSAFGLDVNFAAQTTIGGNAGSLNLTGTVSGNGFRLAPTFSMTLSLTGGGSNSLGGTSRIEGGAVLLNKSGTAIGGTIEIAGGTLDASGTNQFAPGSIVDMSNGFFNVTSTQTISQLVLTGGNIVLNNNLGITSGITHNSGAIGISTGPGGLDLAGGNRVIATNSTTVGDVLAIGVGMSNGSFTKVGAGQLDLFGLNSFTGTNTINAGLVRTSPVSIGNSVVNNAVIDFLGGGTYSGSISGTGSVIISSFLQLASPQSYTGGTTVNGGATLVGTGSTLGGTIAGDGMALGDVIFNQSTNSTFAGSLTSTLKVSKSGTGVLTLGGTNTYTGPTVLEEGGLRFTSNTAIGSGPFQVGAGFANVSLEAVGNITVSNATSFSANTSIEGSGNLNLASTNVKNTNFALVHNSTGNTDVTGKFTLGAPGSIVLNAGTLALGDASIVGGFVAAGPITVNAGTLTLRSLNFISLPDVTLAGGTLNAVNGYAIPLGAALQGNGGVTGRVASANGSTIIATGALVMGDASHVAGVNLDGELYTGSNTVTLQDANQAVLGSYTRVGTASANGTLVANKGAVVNFGRNIEGRGQVQSINTLANAIIMNGDASGDSIANYLEFTGYVKGVGTFNNVAFSGTFSPGLSPALLTVGNVVLTPSNVLEIELGGLLRGSQYDAFDITGTMSFAGQLKLTLINSFTPSLGDQFNIFDGATVGSFSSFFFPPLTVGLVWDTSLLPSQGIVQVVAVPEPTTLGTLAAAGMAFGRRRRRDA